MTKRRAVVLQPEFMEDLHHWINHDRKTALRVVKLMKAIAADPFVGIGKPEPLKHMGPDVWSRRLTLSDRMVYRVFDDKVDFLQGRYHYDA